MGRSSKRKGSAWERRFVSDLGEGELAIEAQRVPHSGAMAGYPDDVVLTEFVDPERRVEVKYRAAGNGFRRLHSWIGGADALMLQGSGLIVFKLEAWRRLIRWRLDEHGGQWLPFDAEGAPGFYLEFKSASRQKGLLRWLGQSDALALRKSNAGTKVSERTDWLVCESAHREKRVFANK